MPSPLCTMTVATERSYINGWRHLVTNNIMGKVTVHYEAWLCHGRSYPQLSPLTLPVTSFPSSSFANRYRASVEEIGSKGEVIVTHGKEHGNETVTQKELATRLRQRTIHLEDMPVGWTGRPPTSPRDCHRLSPVCHPSGRMQRARATQQTLPGFV